MGICLVFPALGSVVRGRWPLLWFRCWVGQGGRIGRSAGGGAAAGAPAALVGSGAGVRWCGVAAGWFSVGGGTNRNPSVWCWLLIGVLGRWGLLGRLWESVEPAGLTVLLMSLVDGAPVPMLPGSWGPV